jgi:hypothetical protein
MDAVCERLSPELREFASQMFVPLAWYDLMPVLEISKAVAATAQVSHAEYIRREAAWLGEQNMRGVYKLLLKLSSPEAVCKRFASIYSQLYDFGGVQTVDVQENAVSACAFGIPESLADWWMRATDAYLGVVLTAAGAKNPKIIWKALEPDGMLCGVALVRIPSTTVWK